MILNTGCRTDIPAYYSKWFYKRVKEGYVLTRNPYYPSEVLRYRLDPDVVDCLCFCSKNPEPMLNRINEINKFNQFWFVTVTPYGKDIEPNVPQKEQVMEAFKRLSKIVGINSVSWRYDPIFITEKYSLDFHIESFEKMAENLCGYVDNCVISFIDLYEKTKKNFPHGKKVTGEERMIIGKEFINIGKKYGITIRTCCEGTELKQFGADASGCMTKKVIEKAVGGSLIIPKAKSSIRQECNCLLGSDIGMYNTCNHGCKYCYANYDMETVKNNMKLHNPDSPFLIGGFKEGDTVKDAKQESFYSGQISLFT